MTVIELIEKLQEVYFSEDDEVRVSIKNYSVDVTETLRILDVERVNRTILIEVH